MDYLAAQASHPPGTTEANFSFLRNPPRNILLLKGHSAGIGDLLRSSSAWAISKSRQLSDNAPMVDVAAKVFKKPRRAMTPSQLVSR